MKHSRGYGYMGTGEEYQQSKTHKCIQVMIDHLYGERTYYNFIINKYQVPTKHNMEELEVHTCTKWLTRSNKKMGRRSNYNDIPISYSDRLKDAVRRGEMEIEDANESLRKNKLKPISINDIL
jgi:hypothetical protein